MSRHKFSSSSRQRPDRLNFNCIPYVELNSSKGILRFLVDTGANKNYIDPKHVFKSRSLTKTAKIHTVNGIFEIDKFVRFNPFPESKFVKPSEFYIFSFHKFFDGLIGYEFLQKTKAVIDTVKSKLVFPDLSISLRRKFPEQEMSLNAQETKFAKISVGRHDGDFYLSNDIEIRPSVFVHSGLYHAENNNAFIAISNTSNERVAFQKPQMSAEINNFEIRDHSNVRSEIKKGLFERIRLEHLNEEEKRILLNVIANNQNCFLLENEKLTFTSVVKHSIKTKDEIPVHAKNYRYPYCHKAEIKKQISQMLDQNIIRPSNSPWSSPIWIVPKKKDASGKQKWRLVIDYRKLNEKTIDDRYPIPNITETLDKLGKCNYFSSLDLTSGFYQVEVAPEDVKKTAFNVEHGHFEFTKMPMGLKNAPATFQRVMDHVLREFIGKICVIYLDDILVFSTSLQEHAENLEKILKVLNKFNLKIQLDKCEFMKKETAFLGHIITTEGVKPNPEKISVIKSWPVPKTEKELRGFLGTLGYYRRFIRDFSKITKPLTSQLRKTEKIRHTKEFLDTFEKCKDLLTTSHILQYPDFMRPFVLTTDASNYAIGAVLSQGPIGRDKPIAYASRTLSKTEENYSTIEKELLAIVWACKYFRPYLFGNKFTLFTDHQPLTYIFSMKDASSKLVRWRLKLEEYDYEIKYRKGKQNVVADGLSRIKINSNDVNVSLHSSENGSMQNNAGDLSDDNTVHSADTDDSHFMQMTLKPVNSFSNQIIFEVGENDEINIEQVFPKIIRVTVKKKVFTTKNILDIFKDHLDYNKSNCIFAHENDISKLQSIYKDFFSRNKKLKVVISQRFLQDVKSPEEENELIEKIHNRAHRGLNENCEVLARNFYFPKMKTKVQKFINLCDDCKTAKYDRKPYKIALAETPMPKRPFDIIHIDIFICAPNTFISVVDKLSRFGILIPVKSRSIPDIRRGLIKIFSTYGQPKLIVSDNEPSLKSVEIRGLLQNLNIEAYYTPSNRSEVNGIVERFHSTIAEIFRSIKSNYENLSAKELFKLSVSLYNSTVHSATKLKPIEIFYGIKDGEERPLDLKAILENRDKFFDEVVLELKKKQDQTTKNHNKNREQEPKLENDETVYVARQGIKSKTKPKYEAVKVFEDKTKTFIDVKNRKLHKANLKRKTKA